MMMTESCTCNDQGHPNHEGRHCDRPAVSPADEIEDGVPDRELGAICLECYQQLAVDLHEADPNSVVDLNVSPSFLMCESPSLGS